MIRFLNIGWFCVVLYGLVGGVLDRGGNSEFWAQSPNTALNYNLIFGFLGLIILAGIIGLVMSKNWGVIWSICGNAILAFTSLGTFVIYRVMVSEYESLGDTITARIDNLSIFVIGTVLGILLWVNRRKLGYV